VHKGSIFFHRRVFFFLASIHTAKHKKKMSACFANLRAFFQSIDGTRKRYRCFAQFANRQEMERARENNFCEPMTIIIHNAPLGWRQVGCFVFCGRVERGFHTPVKLSKADKEREKQPFEGMQRLRMHTQAKIRLLAAGPVACRKYSQQLRAFALKKAAAAKDSPAK
jgi:hypothetical protein